MGSFGEAIGREGESDRKFFGGWRVGIEMNLRQIFYGIVILFAGVFAANAADHVLGVDDGDYLSLGGKEWIMLDNSEGYIILRTGGEVKCFDADSSVWEYGDAKAELNTYLNTTFFDGLGGEKDLVDDGSWLVASGYSSDQSIPEYTWTGKIGLMTAAEFDHFKTNGPDLKGTVVKAITNSDLDPNMDNRWWIITPIDISQTGGPCAMVAGVEAYIDPGPDGRGIQGLSNLYLHNCNSSTYPIRPTAYLKDGLYSFEGDGTDGSPRLITIKPKADAGPDQTVDENDSVTLDASNTPDPFNLIASYQWEQTAGTTVTLSAPSAVQTTFTAPGSDNTNTENLIFQLTVTDQNGKSGTDTVTIRVVPKLYNVFVPGTPAKADEVNANFDILNNRIQELSLELDALKAVVCQEHPDADVCK